MMDGRSFTVAQIAEALGGRIEGDGSVRIASAGSLAEAGPGQITFAVSARRARELAACRASAALVGPDVPAVDGLTLIRVDDPEAAFAAVLEMLGAPEDLPAPGVHGSAVVAPSARLGEDVAIGPCAVVGANVTLEAGVVLAANVCVEAGVTIGAGSVLMPGVVVRHGCRIGRRCRIAPNAVIGADGFGYYTRRGVHHRVPHVGVVEIGDDVEIGACACVDRAKFGATRIGDGSKIDNLVQVAHNVQVGRGVLMAAQVGIAGSVRLGDGVVFGGQAGSVDHLDVPAGTVVMSSSVIVQQPGPQRGQVLVGIPAKPPRQHWREVQLVSQLPAMRQQLKELQSRLDALEQKTTHDRP